jgi:hypothetical protein
MCIRVCLVVACRDFSHWSLGVRNPTASGHLKRMKVGDKIFVYHSGGPKAIVGVASVARYAHQRSFRLLAMLTLCCSMLKLRCFISIIL